VKILKNLFRYYWQYILIFLIIVSVVVGFFYYKNTQSKNADNILLNFNDNYQFAVPKDFVVDSTSIAGTTLVMPQFVEQYNPQNYLTVIEKGGIVLKNFPVLNQDDAFFETYVKNTYKSNDTADFDVDFEQVGKYKVATINVKYKSEKLKDIKEYIKIVNLTEPVLISSSSPSENVNSIIKSLANVNSNDEYTKILDQIKLISTLLKANMVSEIYSLFSTEQKSKISENDFKSIFKQSEKIAAFNYTFNSGALNIKNKEFSFNIVFVDPQKTTDYRAGSFALKNEKGKWLISKFELPKDNNSNTSQTNNSQDVINKAIEDTKK